MTRPKRTAAAIKKTNEETTTTRVLRRRNIKNGKRKGGARKMQKAKSGVAEKKIPEKKLQRVLDILHDDKKFELLEDGPLPCAIGIHNYERNLNYIPNHHLEKMKIARTCLLRRDWCGLAKLLLLCDPSHGSTQVFYLGPIIKYAAILFSHKDKSLLELFLQSLDCNQSAEEVIKRMTSLPVFEEVVEKQSSEAKDSIKKTRSKTTKGVDEET